MPLSISMLKKNRMKRWGKNFVVELLLYLLSDIDDRDYDVVD